MNSPAVLSVLAAMLHAAAGALALRVSRAPGWRELRWFAVVAFLAALHAGVGLGRMLVVPPALALAAVRVELSLDLAILFAWIRYAEVFSQVAAGRAARALELAVLGAGLLVLFPGLAVVEPSSPLALASWLAGSTSTPLTASGWALLLLGAPGAALVIARFRLARRGGVRFAGVHAAAFGAVIALVAADIAAGTSGPEMLRIFDLGFLLPVGLITWSGTLRFLDGADDLATLRGRLESLVEERTRALLDTREALARAERLASLGQLANGVAHQVSNPASVVTANLHWLAENAAADREAHEVTDDALAAMNRINQLVRRLADAGRIAAVPRHSTAVELHEAVHRSLAEVRSSLPELISLAAEVPRGLHVRTRSEVLDQVLQSLLANAADAVPPGRAGRIEVRAERRGGGIRLTVSDDGVGMVPEVLERAFEPFFTTKPPGEGSGLGLPISRGVVEVHGGALWLESAPERGTTAVLELPEGSAA
jgi:signal transduction histidine kinase